MVHYLLRSALEHVSLEERYCQSAHLGGPAPILPRRSHVRIARWCAGLVAPFVHSSMAPLVAHLLMRVDSLQLGWSSERADSLARAIEAIEVEALNLRIPDEATEVALLSTQLAWRVSRSQLRHVMRATRRVTANTAKVLVSRAPRESNLGMEFVAALDDQLLRAELDWAARGRVPDLGDRLAAIRFRRADSSGTPCLWVVRLRDGHGALVRERGFHWAEGPVDVVLAIVPAKHREDAARAISSSSL